MIGFALHLFPSKLLFVEIMHIICLICGYVLALAPNVKDCEAVCFVLSWH